MTKQSFIKNSNEENHFIKELINSFKGFNMSSIQSIEAFEDIIQSLAISIERTWHKYSKNINITKHSKAWWDESYHRDLNAYRQSRCLED